MRKKKTKSLVLFGNGINCEYETAHANRLAGFDADLMHIDEMMENPKSIHRYVFINFPGGFLDGDDLGSAKAQSVKWKHQMIKGSQGRFLDELVKFVCREWKDSTEYKRQRLPQTTPAGLRTDG
jgi:phosphoribosylformylglycinamidine (FGAM) synthase-like amidotransferase family enzyme